MSDLPQAGVQLVAADADQFFGQLDRGNQALQQFGQQATQTASQFGVLDAAEARTRENIADLTDKIGLQQRQLGILQTELKQTTDKYGEGSLQAQRKQLAVDKLTSAIEKNERELAQENAALARYGQQVQESGQKTSAFAEIASRAGQALMQFGVQAFSRAEQAVVDFVGGSIDAATQYQDVLSQIVGLTGTTSEAVQEMSQEVLKLAPAVGIGPKPLAEALYFISSSGFQGAEALDVLTESAKASAAGLGETKMIADLVTSAMNAYGHDVLSAAQATDILTTAVKDGKGEPDEYAAALGRVLPIAAAAGINFQEVAASISTMTLTGLNAAEAVTALRGIIGSLEKPSVQTTKALKSIGLSADDVRASIREKGLLSTLQDLWTRTNGNLDVMGKLIPNVRALTGVLSTTASQGEKYRQVLEDMYKSQGATSQAFAVATQSAAFQNKAFQASIEALQIEIGSRLLPIYAEATKAVTELAQSLLGKAGPAIDQVADLIGKGAAVLRVAFVPAVTAATAALLIYNASAIAGLLTNLPAMTAVLIYNTGAWIANAVAVVAATWPILAIGAAIAAVGIAWNAYNQQVEDATTAMLEGKQWWQDSSAAIADFNTQLGAGRDALAPYAATIRELRSEIESDAQAFAKHQAAFEQFGAASGVSQQQLDQEWQALVNKRNGLEQVTTAYEGQREALLRASAATTAASTDTLGLTAAEQGLGQQTQLTQQEIDKLGKQLQKTFDEGTKAVESYTSSAVSFMASWAQKSDEHTAKVAELHKQREEAKTATERQQVQARIDAENAAYQQQQIADAKAFATQEAAQKAHLGKMLEDYTLAQAQLLGWSDETTTKILAVIERQYGITGDISARTMLQLQRDIKDAGQNGGADMDHLAERMENTTDKAIDLKTQADKLKDKYTMEVVEDFNAHRINAEEFRKALDDIPRRVDVEIHQTVYKEDNQTGKVTGGGVSGTRASGGPVAFGQPYLVGEQGPEVFVPQQAGAILPADLTRALLSGKANESLLRYAMPGTVSPPGVQSLARGGDTIAVDQSRHISMPVYTNMTTSAITQAFAISQAML